MFEKELDQVWLRELGEAEGVDSLLDMQYLCGCCREMCDGLVSAPEGGELVCPECADELIEKISEDITICGGCSRETDGSAYCDHCEMWKKESKAIQSELRSLAREGVIDDNVPGMQR